jgi:phosphate starvation-inducible PhoH-like protein
MKKTIPIGDGVADLFGTHDSNIKYLESLLGVRVSLQEKHLAVEGKEAHVALVSQLIQDYAALRSEGVKLSDEDLKAVMRIVSEDNSITLRQVVGAPHKVQVGNRSVSPKTLNQKLYLDAMNQHDMVFGIGPAGTGKTYLAVSMAVRELLNKRVKRIVLTRPAIEAGERLGFLPGTVEEKIDPYLRPLYDALYDMLDQDRVERYLTRRVIEIAPIAFMRGRTLSEAFVILDEAQNTTSEQMKMFLTRIGSSSKAVINGDVTQIDLPFGKRSGLIEAREILSGISDIAFVTFNERDVVRHPLVSKIVMAYQHHVAAGDTQAALHFRSTEIPPPDTGEVEAN